ncbi:MAG: hypothetical protein PVH00_00970 [Gemmatimonadota bacterium]|jgi:hypothetical protein
METLHREIRLLTPWATVSTARLEFLDEYGSVVRTLPDRGR